MTPKRIRGHSSRLGWSLLILLLLGALTTSVLAEITPADRRIQWDPGVRGDIPARSTVSINVRNAPYSAVGDGVADDTSAIQCAILDCTAGQVVYIPTGTYKITSAVYIKNNITLRGDGIGKTIIKGGTPFGSNFLIGFEDGSFDPDFAMSTARDLSSGYTKGSVSISTSVEHGWSAGDYILIDQLEDPNGDPPITRTGSEGPCTWCGRANGMRPIGQWAKILTVPTTTTATIDPPLYWNYNSAKIPQGIKVVGFKHDSGIEDLTIDNGVSNAFDTVYFHFAINCWLLRVELKGSHRRMVEMYGGLWNTIRSCILHDGVPATPTVGPQYGPDRAYGVFLGPWPTACLIEDNIFYALTLMISLEGAPSGNVIAYNFFKDSYYDDPDWGRLTIGCHGAHPMMNLIEGNHAEDKFDADFYHGSSSHQTFFRNRMFNQPGKLYGSWGFDIYMKSQYFNIVGNVLGTNYENKYELTENFDYMTDRSIYRLGYFDAGDASGSDNDAGVKATMLRHGNWDSVTNTTVWDPAISDRNLPPSLYLIGKPSWWGKNLPWPAIGPDLSPMDGVIPAQWRFNHGSGIPQPPGGPRIKRH